MNPYLRARVIAEWRGLPASEPKPVRLTTIGDGVAKLMKSLGLGERLRQEEVLGAWKEIVGEFIAGHSQPTRLQGGTLFVQVLQSTMHYELDRVWKAKILEKMKARFGPRTVREIKFRVG